MRRKAGRCFICRVKPSRAAAAPLPSILARVTKRVLRSTKVPTEERLAAPLIMSPSQWPGIRRALTSSGRWIILKDSGTMALPPPGLRPIPRPTPRRCLPWRRASTSAAFSPPRGWA